MDDNLIVNLSKKIKYTYKGNPDSETATLEFREAGIGEIKAFFSFKQLVMNSIVEASRFASTAKEDDIPPDDIPPDDIPQPTVSEIKAMLFSAKETQFSTIADKFKVLALKTGTLDGETKLTDGILNKLTIEDYENIICEYIAFFLTPSLLSNEE